MPKNKSDASVEFLESRWVESLISRVVKPYETPVLLVLSVHMSNPILCIEEGKIGFSIQLLILRCLRTLIKLSGRIEESIVLISRTLALIKIL